MNKLLALLWTNFWLIRYNKIPRITCSQTSKTSVPGGRYLNRNRVAPIDSFMVDLGFMSQLIFRLNYGIIASILAGNQKNKECCRGSEIVNSKRKQLLRSRQRVKQTNTQEPSEQSKTNIKRYDYMKCNYLTMKPFRCLIKQETSKLEVLLAEKLHIHVRFSILLGLFDQAT